VQDRGRLGVLLVAPALAAVLVLFVYPLGYSLVTAFEAKGGGFTFGNFSKAFELNRAATSQRTINTAGPQMNVFANLNNAFNMTHPGTPSGVMTSPFFRRSYNATSPRTIEVGMRFQF